MKAFYHLALITFTLVLTGGSWAQNLSKGGLLITEVPGTSHQEPDLFFTAKAEAAAGQAVNKPLKANRHF